MKEKLLSTLGTLGYILWYVISIIIYILPLVMIGKSFFLNLLFLAAMYFFPPSSVVFWIWGLVCAINGPQDIFAIIYYVAFAVMFLPFILSFLPKKK